MKNAMRKILLLLFFTIVLLGCGKRKNETSKEIKKIFKTVLKGKVIDRDSSKTLWLVKQGVSFEVREEIPIVNGSFEYLLESKYLQRFRLIFPDELRNGGYRPIFFINDTDVIDFELFPLESFSSNKVLGGRLNKEREEYDKVWEKFIEELKDLYKMQDSLEIEKREKKFYDYVKQEIEEKKTIHNYSLFVDLITGYSPSPYSVDIFEKWSNEYKIKYPNHYYTKLVASALKGKKEVSNFKDFSIKTKEGQLVKASDLIVEDKLVLVDLWASWCGSCIRKSLKVKENYKELKDKGLQVIAVLGGIQNKEDYLLAKEKYDYPWELYYEIANEFYIWDLYNISNAGGGQFLIDTNKKVLLKDPTVQQIDSILSISKL